MFFCGGGEIRSLQLQYHKGISYFLTHYVHKKIKSTPLPYFQTLRVLKYKAKLFESPEAPLPTPKHATKKYLRTAGIF